MSHVSKIELQVKDLSVLKLACQRLGLEFLENQKNYAWWGNHVGDYPLPEGYTVEDMGKCDHAIKVPGANYELGVCKSKDGLSHHLIWDFWNSGGLEAKLGKDAGLLKQAYGVEKTKVEARRKGYMVTEQKSKKGIRLKISLG